MTERPSEIRETGGSGTADTSAALDSELRFLLEAERHAHRKDNEYLLGEIARLKSDVANLSRELATRLPNQAVMNARAER